MKGKGGAAGSAAGPSVVAGCKVGGERESARKDEIGEGLWEGGRGREGSGSARGRERAREGRR